MKPRNKTAVLLFVIVLVLVGFGFYYVTAIRNSDNRPVEVERQS